MSGTWQCLAYCLACSISINGELLKRRCKLSGPHMSEMEWLLRETCVIDTSAQSQQIFEKFSMMTWLKQRNVPRKLPRSRGRAQP